MKISLVCCVLLAATTSAAAGGLFLPMRGVRGIGQGGALVAGAEDADALWLDPAGLAHVRGAGTRSFLFDVAYVYQPVDVEPVDPMGAAQPVVENLQPGRTPIPTVAAAVGVDDRLTVGAGISAPYAGLHRYPADGAQRYASVSLPEATYVVVTFGAAYRVGESLRVGATVQNVVSSLRHEIVVSMCPGTASCAPDDRTFDSAMSLEQTDYVSPTGSIGAQLDVARSVTLGLVLQGPARVAGTGTLSFSLPSATMFEGARVVGDQASVGFTLPPAVRAGAELRPARGLRVEAVAGAELWSMHDELSIAPDRMRVENVAGINAYDVHAMRISRDHHTAFSGALGIEYRRAGVMLGAGIGRETSAAPARTVSVTNLDAGKTYVGIGGGYADDGWQIGAAVGFVAVDDVDVPLAAARVVQLQPLREAPASVIVNAGRYESSYLLAGLRAARRF